MKDDELRALAQTAVRSPRTPLERLVPWNPLEARIGELASLPAPSFHAHDRIRRAGLIAWDDGWHVTDAGWRALGAAA